jgi:hypothetical protein
MAQPEYVPTAPRDRLRVSERLPTPLAWRADRPAELVHQGGQPVGDLFGVAGPDQGYALKLVRLWDDKLVLAPGEERRDVLAGCVAVAMKRAGLFGRAPVIYDVEVGFAVWGYLTSAGAELVAFRKPLLRGAADDYHVQRRVADHVPPLTLRLTPAEVRSRIGSGDWRSLLGGDETAG